MAKPIASKKSAGGKQTITVNADIEISIERAKFEPNINLDHLDAARIVKGRIEAGEFIGGCCATKVYGIVQDGTVSKLQLSKCEGARRPPKYLKAPLAKAMEAIRTAGQKPFSPMPVQRFIREARRGFIDWDWPCIYICIFGSCYYCCRVDSDTLCGEAIVVKG